MATTKISKLLKDAKRLVYEDDVLVILYVADLMPRHKNWPRGTDAEKPIVKDGKIDGYKRVLPSHWKYSKRMLSRIKNAIFHQTAGGVRSGLDGPLATGCFFVRDPTYYKAPGKRLGLWRGDGRGWPGFAYHLYVLYVVPFDSQGRLVVLQTQDFNITSWHTGGANSDGIGIAFQGLFRSIHNARFKPSRDVPNGKPSPDQLRAATHLAQNVVHKLFDRVLVIEGHFDYGKLTCPGDDIEKAIFGATTFPIIGTVRRTLTELPDPRIELQGWRERQAALHVLGADLGRTGTYRNGIDGDYGEKTRGAIEALEERFGIAVDGVWDYDFDLHVNQALNDMGVSGGDIENLALWGP